MIGLATAARAVSPNEARVTRVTNDVQLLDPIAATRRASLNDSVREGTVVRTGKDFRDSARIYFRAPLFKTLTGARDAFIKMGVVESNLV